MKYIKLVLGIIIFSVILVFLSIISIQNINCVYFKILWHNLKFISEALYIFIPLLLILLFSFLVITNKWALRIEKMNIGGFSILFDNPIKIYKRQVRNYLDTKRTVFKIDLNNDNFNETLDSYYDVYKFFREEIKMLGDISEIHIKRNDRIRLYNMANETLKVLNRFLTKHQSNYRRWYAYLEKQEEEKYYLTPIGELQKEYPDYEKLSSDFKEVNKYFISRVAVEFNIDTEKWE